MPGQNISIKGIGCSVAASITFGLIPWYVQWLAPLSGLTVFWARIATSTTVAFITLLWLRQFDEFKMLLRDSRQVTLLSFGTILVGFQWWLFVWAPVNNLTKELSLGYFLLPLTLVLTGRIVYGGTFAPVTKNGPGGSLCGRLPRTVYGGLNVLGSADGCRTLSVLLYYSQKNYCQYACLLYLREQPVISLCRYRLDTGREVFFVF